MGPLLGCGRKREPEEPEEALLPPEPEEPE